MTDKTEFQPIVLSPTPGEAHTGSIHQTVPSARLQRESLLDIIENYLTYYASGESHTARAKRYDLQHFLLFLAGSTARVAEITVEEWTLQRTKDFVDDRLARGEAPATVSRRLATIKHLGRTLAERVHGYVNPAREVKSPVVQPTKPHGLDENEIHLLRAAARAMLREGNSPEEFIPLRNQMMLEMLLATGLRADEVRLLLVSQLSEDLTWLKNVKTKGRKFRNVYVSSEVRAMLKNYLLARDAYLRTRFPGIADLSDSERSAFPVFVSSYHADISKPRSFGLSAKSIWRIIAELGKRANSLAESSSCSVSRLHPHRLRHTFAHGLLDSSRDIRLVAQALGHSDVRTTMRYTERSDEQIAAAIESRHSKKTTP